MLIQIVQQTLLYLKKTVTWEHIHPAECTPCAGAPSPRHLAVCNLTFSWHREKSSERSFVSRFNKVLRLALSRTVRSCSPCYADINTYLHACTISQLNPFSPKTVELCVFFFIQTVWWKPCNGTHHHQEDLFQTFRPLRQTLNGNLMMHLWEVILDCEWKWFN